MKNPSAALKVRNAFSLIEMAVVLIIIGLMSGLILQSERAARPSNCYTETQAQLASVTQAIETFVRNNNRYPLPAARNVGVGNVNYGREAPSATDASIDRIANGGDAVLAGALPFQALGLPDSYAADCWGNKLSYAVTQILTDASPTGFPSPSATGAISIRSGTIASPNVLMNNAAYAVVSHGEDGVGAVAKNYSGVGHGWCALGTHIDTENCDVAAGGNVYFHASTFNNGKNAGALFFDDLIVFSGKRNSNCNMTTYNATWGASGHTCGTTINAPNLPLSNGAQITVNDTTNMPSDGQATYRCINGALVLNGYSCGGCSVDPFDPTPVCGAGCPDADLTWNSGNCGAHFTGVSSGTVTASTPNTLPGYSGSAQARCSSGSWSIEPGATCNASTPVTCAAGTLSWGGGCNASVSMGNDADVLSPLNNTAVGYTGNVTATCTAGSWVLSGGSCTALPPPCPGGTYSWGPSGHCQATFPSVNEGDTSAAQANTLPGYSGTATASCSGGVLTLNPINCDPVPPTDCPATNLHWGAGCDAIFPTTVDGGTVTGNPNTAPGFSGAGDATCIGGAWQPATGSCTTLAAGNCPTAVVSWGPGCSATFNSTMDTYTDGPHPNTAAGFTGMGTMMCNGGIWNDAGSTCNPLPPGDCPAMTVNWDATTPGCTGTAPYTPNGGVVSSITNTNPAYTGTWGAQCSAGTWVNVGATCSVAPSAVFCGNTGGCGNGGSGYTFYNDVVDVYCQPGKCASTPGHSQYWNCGGVVPAGVQTYTKVYCLP